MIKCKRCSGFIYEEEVFWEDDGAKKIQLGCYTCPHKVYVDYKQWQDFKAKLKRAVHESKTK